MDATPLRGICGFDDPYVALGLGLSKFLVVSVEIVELIWKDVSVRDKIVLISAESLLHFYIVIAKSVLSCDLIALREVIDSLELIQAFIQVTFARACSPEDVPFVRICEVERVSLEDGPDKLCVALK